MVKSYDDIVIQILLKKPFAFTRWGDGEWLNIAKSPGGNCDGNLYYHDLGEELDLIAKTKQDYILGAQDLTYNLPSSVHKYPNQDWIDADIFHKASMEGRISLLTEALLKEHIVYIGNKDLKPLPFIDEFIEIPPNNVWTQRNDLLEKINKTIDKDKHKVYLFSAGMATNVFIDKLWKLNKTQTYIDVGSVFDPYVGKHTRSYHKTLKI
tara:strand:+ start:5141 stop:5767 length:627 start_codon:yes stop_codon:yes gene_type:complete